MDFDKKDQACLEDWYLWLCVIGCSLSLSDILVAHGTFFFSRQTWKTYPVQAKVAWGGNLTVLCTLCFQRCEEASSSSSSSPLNENTQFSSVDRSNKSNVWGHQWFFNPHIYHWKNRPFQLSCWITSGPLVGPFGKNTETSHRSVWVSVLPPPPGGVQPEMKLRKHQVHPVWYRDIEQKEREAGGNTTRVSTSSSSTCGKL